MSHWHFRPHHHHGLQQHTATCLCTSHSQKLRDRNCNLTLERSCTMYTVPRGRHTLTDEQRCTCLSLCINAHSFSRSLSSWPCPDLSLAPSCTCQRGQRQHSNAEMSSTNVSTAKDSCQCCLRIRGHYHTTGGKRVQSGHHTVHSLSLVNISEWNNFF